MPPLPQFRSKPRKPNCVIKSLINLCSKGHLREAVNSLDFLAEKGLRLDSRILAFLLQQCASTKSLKEGIWVHLHLKLTGLKRPSTFLSNHLINMYFKCGDHVLGRKVFNKMSVRNLYSWNNVLSGYAKLGMVNEARSLFDQMPEKDVVSWNTMVICYVQSGFLMEALRFYGQLRKASIGYNAFSFAGVLSVSVKLRDVNLTRQLHSQVMVSGFASNLVLASSVLDAYAKCGEMCDARRVFDEMWARDICVWTTLVWGYARWGDMNSAKEMFDMMPDKNAVSWTALVSGYARNGLGHNALEVFRKMMLYRVRPNQFTFSSSLCACASIAMLKHGKQIHAFLIRTGVKPNTIVVSSLIDMYSKCGYLELCKRVFRVMDKKDVILWNCMISALAQDGCDEEAIKMFDEMVMCGVKPNKVTFLLLLSACRHSGFEEKGLAFFDSMIHDYGIPPDKEHYALCTQFLGRDGHFGDSIKQLEKMPSENDYRIENA